MKMRSFVAAVSIVACVYFPVVCSAQTSGDRKPKLRNGDSLGVRNATLFRSPLDSGTADRELRFEVCAGNPALVMPTGGLTISACVPGAAPVSCSPMGTSPIPRMPFGACLPYVCMYGLTISDPRTGPTSEEESLQPLNTHITATPSQADLIIVDQAEYNMLIGLGKNPRKSYLESRNADRAGTLIIVKETVGHDDPTVPDSSPEIFSDGFESGDVSAWNSSTSPTAPLSTVP